MQPIHSATPAIFKHFVHQSQTYPKFDKPLTDHFFVLTSLRIPHYSWYF